MKNIKTSQSFKTEILKCYTGLNHPKYLALMAIMFLKKTIFFITL